MQLAVSQNKAGHST